VCIFFGLYVLSSPSHEIQLPILYGTYLAHTSYQLCNASTKKTVGTLYIRFDERWHHFYLDAGVLFWGEGDPLDPENGLDYDGKYRDLVSELDVSGVPIRLCLPCNRDQGLVAKANTIVSSPKAVVSSPRPSSCLQAIVFGSMPKKEIWQKSKAKGILRAGILNGTITADMEARQIYDLDPEHQKWRLSNWTENLKTLRAAIARDRGRMAADARDFGRDKAVVANLRPNDKPAPCH
jgi:hypothetical protein